MNHHPRSKVGFAAVFVLLALAHPAAAQLVASAIDPAGDRPLLIFPTPGLNLPSPTQIKIPTAESGLGTVPISVYSSRFALLAEPNGYQVGILDLQAGTVVDLLPTPSYSGLGTLAVAPSRAWALAMVGDTLTVIHAPFTALSLIHTVAMPGSLDNFQTQAVTFNQSGRAFVYHAAGISVLDPPYASISFTIPADNFASGPIAISPDGETLMVATGYLGGPCMVFRAPYSASSTPEEVFTPSVGITGLAIAPDGTFAVAAGYTLPTVYVISAPFGASSTVETLPLPTVLSAGPGFEHATISAKSDLVVVTGGSYGETTAPYAFIEPPFTAAGATVHGVSLIDGLDRGGGSAGFVPAIVFADGFESGDTSGWGQTSP